MSRKIGVDLHLLSGKHQGSRTFLVNILAEILRLDRDNEYFVYLNDRRGFYPALGLVGDEWERRKNIRLREYAFKSPLLRIAVNLPALEFRDRLDIFHSQYISPPITFARDVVTVHDILYETHPQYFTRPFVLRSKLLIRTSARRAKMVLTDSLFSKSQLIDTYKIPEDRIEVVQGGVNTQRFNRQQIKEAGAYIENKFRLRDFILNVGRLEPRKNQLLLVKAYHQLIRTRITPERLVIIGGRDFLYEPIYRYVQENNLDRRVVILNAVADDELPLFFKAATLFVYPSFAEGFGLPVLEAMACGTPVIASDSTSIPEIAGEACVLIDPGEMSELSRAMAGLLDDPARREELTRKAVERAGRFSWKTAALKTLQVYNKL